jgi:hypothetical protein
LPELPCPASPWKFTHFTLISRVPQIKGGSLFGKLWLVVFVGVVLISVGGHYEILSNVVYVESTHQFIITVKQLVSLVLLRRRI